MLPSLLPLSTLLISLSLHAHAQPQKYSISENVLLLQAPGSLACEAPGKALLSMNIPHTLITVKVNETLSLTENETKGKYSLFLICSDRLAYKAKDDKYPSALSDDQWKALDDYQHNFKVRRINLDVWPAPKQGVNSPVSGSNTGKDQPVSLTEEAFKITRFTGINPEGVFDTDGLGLHPATLLAPSSASSDPTAGKAIPVVKVVSSSSQDETRYAGVITVYPTGREEMNFFMAFGPWSSTCAVLQQLWIQWGTRNTYAGIRRAYLNVQIDDVMLESPVTVNGSAPGRLQDWDAAGNTEKVFRTNFEDYKIHAEWQKSLNAKLPRGSDFRLEMGFNGNGPLIASNPKAAVYTASTTFVPNTLMFKKPLGTGSNLWPVQLPSLAEASYAADPLYTSFMSDPALKASFFWVSHTFTHMELNNATIADTTREIEQNQIFADRFKISDEPYFAPDAMIPPAITGLLNGDALKAIYDRKVTVACGDNTRPELRSPVSPYHPLISNMKDNGFDGLTIIPRYATAIYFNVTNFVEEEYLHNNLFWETFGAKGHYVSWQELYKSETERVTNLLLNLHPDAYMFHQCNLRASDITTPHPVYFPSGRFSLVMLWVEMVAAEWRKYVTWPLISAHMSDMGRVFLARQRRDRCGAKIRKIFEDGHLVAVEVSGGTEECTWPVTVPGGVKSREPGWKYERLRGEPLTVWVPTKPGETKRVELEPRVDWAGMDSARILREAPESYPDENDDHLLLADAASGAGKVGGAVFASLVGVLVAAACTLA